MMRNKDLILTCLTAQSEYTLNRIQSAINREIYRETIDNIIAYVEFYEPNAAMYALKGMEIVLDSFTPNGWFGQGNQVKYKMLALNQADDIVKSIEKRFG